MRARFLLKTAAVWLLAAVGPFAGLPVAAGEAGLSELLAALLAETPLAADLKELSREIGGRATGSEANLRSVDWAAEKFREAGVSVRTEAFPMPSLWLETESSAVLRTRGGDSTVQFEAAVAAMPFSAAAPAPGMRARLLDAGYGTEQDFDRLGDRAGGAFLLIRTDPLLDVAGLFKEYSDAYEIEKRAAAAGVAGVAYMSSRAEGLLYRHNSSLRGADARPMMVLERGAAERALDLLELGRELELTAVLDLEVGRGYDSHNVIGEIRGSAEPEEFVVVGAHLDAWDLGDGALDNGANVTLLIDVARQMKKLGLEPRRTIRFALWNGEEQGLWGSAGYAKSHADELDRHVVAMSFDIGCGAINGFFSGGRPEVVPVLEKILEPVRGLGPFAIVDVPIVGTDNFDFMMEGVANLVGNHEDATYGPNYHAQSDRFDQCDLKSVRLNSAIVAAVAWGFAQAEIPWRRQSRAEIEALIESTDLEAQMRMFNVWHGWADGARGRAR